MGTKAEETAPGATGCLAKAKDDEPIFILRAQDELAPIVVCIWAAIAKKRGTSKATCEEALDLAARMEAWADEHGGKVPD